MANPIQRLIQFVLRGKDDLSTPAHQATEAMEALRAKTGELNQALDSAKDARGLIAGLSNTERAIVQTEKSVVRAETTVRALRDALDKNPGSKGLETSLKAAEREAASLRRNLDALTTKHAEQERAAKEAGVDTSKLADEERRLAAEVSQAKEKLSQATQELRELERQQRRTSDSASGMGQTVQNIKTGVTEATLNFGKWLVSIYLVDKALQGLAAGFGLIKDGIGAVIADGSDGEAAMAQLEASLKSTGNAAGLTSEKLLEMAEGLRDASMLSTEEIVSAETRLLSYTDILAKEFPDALQVTIDQAERLGISVEQSAETVGKALQSPSDAMAALGRQGFKLEAGQKELMQQLEATGRKAEAQRIILDMMSEAYGGAAAAAKYKTFQGLWKSITDQFGDFAGMVGGSGAFDYIKRKMEEVRDSILRMRDDGSLERLAQGFANAFVQGAEWIGQFITKMGEVDFKRLTDDSAAWMNDFGAHLDEAAKKVEIFTAPFKTLWYGLTGGLSQVVASFAAVGYQIATLAEDLGKKLPDSFGGEGLAEKARVSGEVLKGIYEGMAGYAEESGKKIIDVWEKAAEPPKKTAVAQAEAVKEALDETFEHTVQRVTGINNALAQISAADSVAQLRQLGSELYSAFKRGDLTQQEFSQSSAVLNARLKEMGGAATSAAPQVGILAANLKSLTDVQDAIASAKTDLDIENIRKAVVKLNQTGVLSTADYQSEIARLNARQAELKKSTDSLSKSTSDQAASADRATQSMEEQRRASGQLMEQQRRAMGEAMEAHRKGTEDTKEVTEGAIDFFSDMLSSARQPLAELSSEALQAFDALRGISSADVKIDTSSLESTTESLRRMREEKAKLDAAASSPGISSLGRWALSMKADSDRTAVSFLEQKQQLLSLLEGYEKGDITVRSFLTQAQAARNGMNLLNDSDLRQLESTIESAKQRMQQLSEGSRDTLAGLQEELAGLRGEQEAVDRSKFASRQRDLQQQLADAQAGGDLNAVENLMRALGTLKQIETETNSQRQLAEQKARVEAQNAAQPAATTATEPAAPATTQPMKTIRLELQGRTVDVGVTDDGTQLLDLLGVAAMRTS
ncbi:phage tail length tape measure family protein [Pseudomonas sp. CAN2814]|uniref:phage tail length tape measure family protein n=1 Tax=Pseudomonas sp. CAN1 TaxID=3046726 RepID=UPI002649C656|nr:phage tail length tape measure family protein [Pseudomonas sp. CAN1]MDN6857275.1 phage tail length tape measure family protein [Pseudomonas sp. CAN1]